MNVRERWYALHRARRVFRRDQQRIAKDLLVRGWAQYKADVDSPIGKYLLAAVDMAVNPPYIYDPILEQIWSKKDGVFPSDGVRPGAAGPSVVG